MTRDGEAHFMPEAPAPQPSLEAMRGKAQPQLGEALQLGAVPVMPSRNGNGNGTSTNGNGRH